MFLWLALYASWQGRSFWSPLNLLATTFYGDASLTRDLQWMTVSGAALGVLVAGTGGVLFGLLSPLAQPRMLRLAGVLFGVVWYHLWFGLLWDRVGSLVVLYSPGRPELVGHLLFGLTLGFLPKFLPAQGSQQTM
jgi:hypothetical protein